MTQTQASEPRDIQYRLPAKLLRLQDWLRYATLSHQPPQIFYPEKWLDAIQLDEIGLILERHPNSIRRLDIVPFATEAVASENGSAIRQLFLATMLWGYGTVGYGPWRMAHITKDIDQLDHVLLTTLRNIKHGAVHAAYNTFQNAHIPFLGQSYFTKYLYFAGLGCGVNHYPLILDTRILQSLTTLLGTRYFSNGTADDYLSYLITLHEWAEIIDCRADSIEYLLSLTPQEFWQI